MNKQYNINKKDINFANIVSLAEPSKYPKICDFCSNVFEADVRYGMLNNIHCPICGSLYFVVYNALNEFYYLEFVKSPEDFVFPQDYHFQMGR